MWHQFLQKSGVENDWLKPVSSGNGGRGSGACLQKTTEVLALTFSWFPLQNADPTESQERLFQLPHQL